MKPKREDFNTRHWRNMRVEDNFAAFWEGPYVTPQGDVCSICGGDYPFSDEYGWGIKPDRKFRPSLFICWECVHWLLPILVEHVRSSSYSHTFDKYPPFTPTIGLQGALALKTSEGSEE